MKTRCRADVATASSSPGEIGRAQDELDWLARNQPKECYREEHSGWRAVVETFGQGFAMLEAALDPPDPASGVVPVTSITA